MSVETPKTAVFLGCWRTVGHYFRTPDGQSSITRPEGCPWEKVDGALTPRSTGAQGAAALHHKDGWTALGVHDYTIDHRPGSNATFLFDAVLDFDGATDAAGRYFPSVFRRLIEGDGITLFEEDGQRV